MVDVGGIRQIFTKNLDSAVPSQVTKSPADCSNPFWSPDGTRIYYNAQGHLWSISAAGGLATVEVDDADVASIAADGKTLALLRGAGGHLSLWFAAGRGSAPEQYQTPPFPRTFTRSWSIDFSSDGSKLAVLIEQQGSTGFDEELWIVPYPAGVPRRVPTALVGLAGLPTDVDSGRQLAMKELQLPPSAIVRGFALHPDGKSFATSVGMAKFDIWLLHGLNSSR